MGGPDMAPHTPPPAPRSSWGLDRVSEPEGAPTPRPAPRSSWGLDRVSEPDTAGGSSRPGGAVALLGIPRAPAGLLGDGLELGIAPHRGGPPSPPLSRHTVGIDGSPFLSSSP